MRIPIKGHERKCKLRFFTLISSLLTFLRFSFATSSLQIRCKSVLNPFPEWENEGQQWECGWESELLLQETGGVGSLALDDFLWCAGADDVTAFLATLGADVDDMVGTFDDIHVVFNDKN